MAVTEPQAALHLRLIEDDSEAAYNASPHKPFIPRLLRAAVTQIERHAPDAPDDVKDEATIRLCGWLFDSGFFAADERPAVSSAGALTKSGAAGLLRPWRVHRAGAC